jgi:adenine-specific DNA-methyltransferase
MARGRKKSSGVEVESYRHDGEKRTNIPPAKMAAEGSVPKVPRVKYAYNPHLSPELRFDPTGEADKLQDLIAEAGRRTLKPEEQKRIAEAVGHYQPWLEWAGKRECRIARGLEAPASEAASLLSD